MTAHAGSAQASTRARVRWRRWLASFALGALALAAQAQPGSGVRIDFVYFGSADCPYCRGWEAHDLVRLEQSRLFRRVHFAKISKAIAAPVPPASSFPSAIRPLRDPIAHELPGAGSPMFALLAYGRVVASWRGAKKYSADQIQQLIAAQVPRAAAARRDVAAFALLR